jgi:predicted nucleic acid-binding protein
MGQIDLHDWAHGRQIVNGLAKSWSVIEPLDSVRRRAIHLVERYHLRAADSLQLSAALEWCEGDPHSHTFLTADLRLQEAALQAGFNSRSSLLLRE